MQKITIPCELTITPGGANTQAKLALSLNGETVFDDYEQSLTPQQQTVCKEIVAAHARLLSKWAEVPVRKK